MWIDSHLELDVYKKGFELAMQIFWLSKEFPIEERYSLTDQVRRSSRSVCANLAEAWAKRRYEAHFVSKLTDSVGEAGETQTWLELAVSSNYLEESTARQICEDYNRLIHSLNSMIHHSEKWCRSPVQ